MIRTGIKRLVICLMVLCAIILSGCNMMGTIVLEAPVIELNDNIVSWEAVKDAAGYEVKVGINKYKVTETTYTIEITEPGSYEVSVSAYSQKDVLGKRSNKIIYVVEQPEIIKLDAPVAIKESNVVKWTTVANATGYELYLNGELLKVLLDTEHTFDKSEPGTYKYSVKAISTNPNYSTSEMSNEVEFVIAEEVEMVKLATPVVTLSGTTISWAEIEHADRYFVYVNGELVDIVTDPTFTYEEALYGDYSLTVSAVSNDNSRYLTSDTSDPVSYYKPIQDTALDLSKPVSMFTLNWKVIPTINENDEFVKGSAFGTISNYQGMSYLFIKDGDFYRIKLDNGMYLTHIKLSGSMDGFVAAPKAETPSQLYHFNTTGNDGFMFTLAPLSNPGYLVCENGSNGYHQYMQMEDNGVINPQQVWVLFNVNTTIADDVIAEPVKPDTDLTKPVLMYTISSSKMPAFNNERLMVKGETYNAEIDQTAAAFQLIQVGEYYMIKTADGYYLTYRKDGGDKFYKEYKTGADNQLFILEPEDKNFKIFPVLNQGYVVCEDDYNGYHLYSFCGVDSQRWIMVNVETEIAEDKVEEVEPTFTFEKPVLMYTKSSSLMPAFDSNGLMITGETFSEASTNAFMFIAVGDRYMIKTADGYYLTYRKDGGDKFYKEYKTGEDNQLFIVEAKGDVYTLAPVANPGYLICENGAGGYHQYSDCGVDSQRWVMVNVETEIAEDKVEEVKNIVLMYTKSSSLMPAFDNNGLMITGEAYSASVDQSAHAFELIADGDYYRIKTNDGLYLTHINDGSDKFYKLEKSDENNQLFIITLVGENYTIAPLSNPGYLLCENGAGGYHQYSDCGVDSQRWVFVK